MAPILVSREGAVLSLTLNRPDKLNAFNPEMHTLLRAALEEARDEAAVRAVLLTGSGRGFCAGQDLSERNISADAAPIDLSGSLGSKYNPLGAPPPGPPNAPARGLTARAAEADRVRGERRCRGRRRQHRTRLRYRAGGSLGQLRAVVLQA